MIHMIEFQAMGCQINVQLEAAQHGAVMLRDLPKRFASIEAALTRFDPSSELMQLNQCAGEWVMVSELLFANIRAAKHAALLTDGLYNPLILSALNASGYDRSFEQIDVPAVTSTEAVPDWRGIDVNLKSNEVRIPAGAALDLGGIAKGWTATTIADELAQFGACLVNLGGDMVGRSAPDGFPGWVVEIVDPFTSKAFTTVYLRDQAISTSGIDYRRWQSADGTQHHHIIDPRTGEPAVTDVLSATVIHPSTTTAEAYTKALILRGAEDGLNWLNRQWHTAGLVFSKDGATLATSTFIHERNLSS
jgi:thiamine biosynthesis lipoprotein